MRDRRQNAWVLLLVLAGGTLVAGCSDDVDGREALRPELEEAEDQLAAAREQAEVCRAITAAVSRELGNLQELARHYQEVLTAINDGRLVTPTAIAQLQRLEGRGSALFEATTSAYLDGGEQSLECLPSDFREQVEDVVDRLDTGQPTSS